MDEEFCSTVSKVLEILPDAGVTYIIEARRQRNTFAQRQCIRRAINTVDSVKKALRRSIDLLSVQCSSANFIMVIKVFFDYVAGKTLYFSFFMFLLLRSIVTTSQVFLFCFKELRFTLSIYIFLFVYIYI